MVKKVPNPVDVHVGSRVRMRRMMLSISQEKLGDALGLTFQQVQKYEKGANRIGASRLQQISQILQVPVQFFYDGAPVAPALKVVGQPVEPVADYTAGFLATTDGLTIAQWFQKITSPEVRRKYAELIKAQGSADEAVANAQSKRRAFG